jgi:hypothetical protein
MPGLDLTQLVAGITYPNVTYLNNPFEPSQQYLFDSEISDKTFTNTASTIYDLQGAPFAYGYGPEELVPGNISDGLTLIVNTTPGTTWNATEYQNVGYNSISVELVPTSGTQTLYSFRNLAQAPAQISVYVVNGTTNLAIRLSGLTDYNIDWINKTIELDTPLTFLPISDKLLVNIYEFGNGNQVVKTTTDVTPLILNETTNSYEIFLNYNYYNGIIRDTGNPFNVTATQTISATNSIVFSDVSYFYVNQAIVFAGTTFGNIVQGDTYYVKNIDINNSRITVSDTINGTTGIAGPIFSLGNASGSMTVTIDVTSSSVYTEPIVYRNGVKMLFGSDYTLAPVTSTNLEGLAKIVFATGIINPVTDYISYALFGDSGEDSQYGYTIPETEFFNADGSTSTFDLANYSGGLNEENAIVEVNGERVSNFTIDGDQNTISFTSPLPNGSLAVTTFNNTERQYFNTEYDITGKYVYAISNINNSLYPYSAVQNVVSSSSTGNIITLASTSGISVNQTVQFAGTNFGNVLTDGTVYYVLTVSGSNITISQTLGGTVFNPGNAPSVSGTVALVGGQLAVRVTFSTATNLVDNDVIRIDGVEGSVQLNNNTYYVKKISTSEFDLYTQPYASSISAINFPVTEVNSYVSGGYGWEKDNFLLTASAIASATATSTNNITVDSTAKLVEGTPVYFTQMEISSSPVTSFGGIIDQQKYYVREIVNATTFTISSTIGGDEVTLTNATGTMNVTQWEQTDTNRIWVTVNGDKISSSLLKINDINELSILAAITNTDEITITTMMPSATPNQEKFFINVNSINQPTVYREGPSTTTYLTQDLRFTDETIYVNDVRTLITVSEQVVTNTVAVSSKYFIGLNADKNLLTSVDVYNETKGQTISSDYYTLTIIDLVPTLTIVANSSYIDDGDILTITLTEGNRIYVGGEQISFTEVDLLNNTLSGLQRGINTTGTPTLIGKYTQVYGFLNTNLMDQDYYDLDWNDGEPLQISNTDAAIFLRTDNN